MKNTTHYKLISIILPVIIAHGSCREAMADTTADYSGIVKTDSARIWFHQSKWNLDEDYMRNERNLHQMLQELERNADSDSALRISAIRVEGAASPEGSVRINANLSRRRADKIFDYFAERIELEDSITRFDFIGRNWAGLEMLVESDENVPKHDEVLQVIREIKADIESKGHDSETNLLKLKRIGGGEPYAYMYRNFFPVLRTSNLYVDYVYKNPAGIALRKLPPSKIDIIAEPPMAPAIITSLFLMKEGSACKPFYMGIKTNLLYDALALPSVGAEFYVGKGWSLVGNWTYGWWDRDATHRYWRAYGGDIALRKWFGKAAKDKPLTGHHLGVYAGVVTYDFEFGGKGYMGGLPGKTLWDRCNFMAGVEYGYSMPIARRLNIDFTLGLGYLWGKLIEYHPYDGEYVWEKTRKLNWIGPTKAEVSLVWLIGCDNYNRKKGGR